MMKSFLLAGLLATVGTTVAQAQTKSAELLEYEALLKENAALKADLARQHKALAVGEHNEQVLVELVSCTASKRTKMATLTFRVSSLDAQQPGAPMSAAVSLKGWPPMVAQLKELNFNFLSDLGDGKPARKFAASLHNVPIVWKP